MSKGIFISVDKVSKAQMLQLDICSRCALCAEYCPTYNETRDKVLIPGERSKQIMSLVKKQKGLLTFFTGPKSVSKEELSDLNKAGYLCTLCGQCTYTCPTGIQTTNLWLTLRNILFEAGVSPQPMKDFSKILSENYNFLGHSNTERADWVDFRLKFNKRKIKKLDEKRRSELRYVELRKEDILKREADVVYFIGCNSSFFKGLSGAADAMVHILNAAGEKATILGEDEWCCGYPFLLAGNIKKFEEFVRHNLGEFKKRKADTVVFTCAGCYKTFKHEVPEILGIESNLNFLHSSQLIEIYFKEGKLPSLPEEQEELVITYHDPCDIGRYGLIYEEPREILRKVNVTLKEMRDTKEKALCCGGGGLMKAVNKELTNKIAVKRAQQVVETKASRVCSGCPSCESTLKEGLQNLGAKVRVLDITEIIAEKLGLLP